MTISGFCVFVPLQPLLVLLYLLRWPVTGVFIVNETLNETRRNTQKLFSHHEETVLQSCSTSDRRRFAPREKKGWSGAVPREEAVA